MATASREGAIFIACLFGVMSLYFAWGALAGTPLFPGHAWANYLGAIMLGLFALEAGRIARHPERHDAHRPSMLEKFFLGLEGVIYIAGALYGIHWLIQKLT